MAIAWRVLVFVLIWLVFECTISWLAFCHPNYEQSAYYQIHHEYCAFKGPLLGAISWGWGRMVVILHERDKEIVAAFTIILAFSTIGLWLATNRLWKLANGRSD